MTVFKFILVAIDVFLKYAYVKCLKNKSSKDVIAAFSEILKRSGQFSTLQTNLGTEFTNKVFQSLLKHHNIHFLPYKTTKLKLAKRNILFVLLKKTFGVILRMKINENIPM